MPLIRKEKIAKPRILLLDFDPKSVEAIKEKGYIVVSGDSGFSGKPLKIDQDPSEFELLFWDCSQLKLTGSQREWATVSQLFPYFKYIKQRNGINTILLPKDIDIPESIFRVTGYKLKLKSRTTTNIIPPTYTKNKNGLQDLLRPLFERFIQDDNIKFSIEWLSGNDILPAKFFVDEDNNNYVAFAPMDLLLFPFVSNKTDFVLCAIQDSFPYLTDDNIFPDVHNIVWLNSDQYKYPEIASLEEKIQEIREKAQEDEKLLQKQIVTIGDKTSFLQKALIADDSDSFSDEDKLKPQITKMFDTLGFKVKDLDKENEQFGQALKEDIQIRDDDNFFALVEVKGTERGAAASWVRTNLNAHITEYARLEQVALHELHSMVVFNHERRIKPEDRKPAFGNDPQLIKYCEKSNITLVPVYELYKLCVAVMTGKIEATEAKALIKKPGLFSFNEK